MQTGSHKSGYLCYLKTAVKSCSCIHTPFKHCFDWTKSSLFRKDKIRTSLNLQVFYAVHECMYTLAEVSQWGGMGFVVHMLSFGYGSRVTSVTYFAGNGRNVLGNIFSVCL